MGAATRVFSDEQIYGALRTHIARYVELKVFDIHKPRTTKDAELIAADWGTQDGYLTGAAV